MFVACLSSLKPSAGTHEDGTLANAIEYLLWIGTNGNQVGRREKKRKKENHVYKVGDAAGIIVQKRAKKDGAAFGPKRALCWVLEANATCCTYTVLSKWGR